MPINVLPEVLAWVDEQVAKGRFFSRTHAFEFGIARLIEDDADAAAGVPQKAMPDDALLEAARFAAMRGEIQRASELAEEAVRRSHAKEVTRK